MLRDTHSHFNIDSSCITSIYGLPNRNPLAPYPLLPLLPPLYSVQPQRIGPCLFFPSDRGMLFLILLCALLGLLLVLVPGADTRRFTECTATLQQSTYDWFHEGPYGTSNNLKTFSEGFTNGRKT